MESVAETVALGVHNLLYTLLELAAKTLYVATVIDGGVSVSVRHRVRCF